MSRTRGRGAYVLGFFLSAFVLLSSGRIASSDAGDQLQAATLLALTGRLGDDGASDGVANAAWVRAPNGRMYQPHDIVNIVLMLPAAWIGSRISAAGAEDDIRNPPAIARVLVSLSCAVLAAGACFWLFKLFALYWDPRSAFVLAAAFPITTFFIAYARAAWDVLGGAVFISGVLYYSARLLRSGPDRRENGVEPWSDHRTGQPTPHSPAMPAQPAWLLAATLAAACSFRFSLAPFIVPPVCAIVFKARRTLPARTTVAAAVLFGLLMLPSFGYNFQRTGSPLRPATASDQYLQGNNALTGSIGPGMYGLLLSPNRGLFLYSPMLLFAVGVPFLWRRLPADQRTLLTAYGAGACAYVLLIAKLANWGAFGWGPRYLVPILPIVFFAAAIALKHLYRPLKPLVVALAIFSFVLTLPPAIVNWHLATTTYDGAVDADAAYPYQQIAGWRALVAGLEGRRLPISDAAAADPARATTGDFPDLLLARVARVSASGSALATMIVIAGVWIAGLCARRVMQQVS